jgi:PAS domain S-box-containing protein
MKNALLHNTQMPIVAMLKDRSVTVSNKAVKELFNKEGHLENSDRGFDLLTNWQVWNEDFTGVPQLHEHPISVLIKTEKPFGGVRIGWYNEEGKEIVLGVLRAIRDGATGEFLAGVVTARDITSMTQEFRQMKEQEDKSFRPICGTMPQLVWTAIPNGSHNFFNTSWYSYPGLTPEESLGLGWKNAFHPDDMNDTLHRWTRSMKTGEVYMTEYRCRDKGGEWRWFLSRALPQRNRQTGEIEKWFGESVPAHHSYVL